MKIKKRNVTLIEMMIVMFLIALVTGVIAYNYRGSLDEGKAFKTKAGMDKVQMILTLKFTDDPDASIDKWEDYIKTSPLVKGGDSLIRDGWGEKYNVERNENGDFIVTSKRYSDYLNTEQGKQSIFK